jgi:hypothetical protein
MLASFIGIEARAIERAYFFIEIAAREYFAR